LIFLTYGIGAGFRVARAGSFLERFKSHDPALWFGWLVSIMAAVTSFFVREPSTAPLNVADGLELEA
jgi:hypothetical protein